MTGAVAATLGAPTQAGGGGGASGAHPNAMAWSNIYAAGLGSTQTLTVAGVVAGPATITASRTGTAIMSCTLNGAPATYGGGFTVSNGDTISWTMDNVTGSTKSGTVTVTSAGGTFTVGTFTYVLTGNTN
ncbi:MAG: hypothetical protein ACYC8V_06730 [Caulobacteraceae bacterium]